jgi:hypothetical protein
MFSDQNIKFIAFAAGILALLLSVYNYLVLRAFNKLRGTFFAGQTGANLETVIESLHQGLQSLQEEHVVLERNLSALQENFTFAFQRIGIVRFNPFGDDGGNLSFCLALLDGNGNGTVLTSMHGRQQNRIYTKKIQDGSSEVPLTTEEQQAITKANSKAQIPNYK